MGGGGERGGPRKTSHPEDNPCPRRQGAGRRAKAARWPTLPPGHPAHRAGTGGRRKPCEPLWRGAKTQPGIWVPHGVPCVPSSMGQSRGDRDAASSRQGARPSRGAPVRPRSRPTPADLGWGAPSPDAPAARLPRRARSAQARGAAPGGGGVALAHAHWSPAPPARRPVRPWRAGRNQRTPRARTSGGSRRARDPGPSRRWSGTGFRSTSDSAGRGGAQVAPAAQAARVRSRWRVRSDPADGAGGAPGAAASRLRLRAGGPRAKAAPGPW